MGSLVDGHLEMKLLYPRRYKFDKIERQEPKISSPRINNKVIFPFSLEAPGEEPKGQKSW